MATRELKTLLDQWGPVTITGKTAKVTLSTCMTNSIPKWRREYEIKQFNDKVNSALTNPNRTLEDLATLYPGRVVTNEYLTADLVMKSWKDKIKSAYDSEYKSYITGCVTTYANKQSSLDNDIHRKAAVVGHPFVAETAIAEIKSGINDKQNAFNQEIEGQCNEWVRENITLRPVMDCHQLFNEYRKYRRQMNRHKAIFNKIVRAAFYQRCEEYFQSSVKFFKNNINDTAKCKVRFDIFKRLCIALAEDSGDSSDVSWAIRFAKKCIDEGKIKDGFENAFRQTFAITRIGASYSGSTPWERFQGLQIGVETDNISPNKVLIETADKKKRMIKEGLGYCLWLGKAEINFSLFQKPTPPQFLLKVLAVCSYKDEVLENENGANTFYKNLDIFGRNPDRIKINQVFSWGKNRLTVDVGIDMKRLSGKSIVELLDEARNDNAKNGQP